MENKKPKEPRDLSLMLIEAAATCAEKGAAQSKMTDAGIDFNDLSKIRRAYEQALELCDEAINIWGEKIVKIRTTRLENGEEIVNIIGLNNAYNDLELGVPVETENIPNSSLFIPSKKESNIYTPEFNEKMRQSDANYAAGRYEAIKIEDLWK